MEDKLKREIREEAHFERLGTRNPRCQRCGNERHPAALTGTAPNVTCYECLLKESERSWTEDHHPAGRNNDPTTVAVPGNDHRVLSDMQRDWPERTLRNPDGSPLLAAAAALRGWLDVMLIIIERTVGNIPAYLEVVDQCLREEWGDRWWERLNLEGVHP